MIFRYWVMRLRFFGVVFWGILSVWKEKTVLFAAFREYPIKSRQQRRKSRFNVCKNVFKFQFSSHGIDTVLIHSDLKMVVKKYSESKFIRNKRNSGDSQNYSGQIPYPFSFQKLTGVIILPCTRLNSGRIPGFSYFLLVNQAQNPFCMFRLQTVILFLTILSATSYGQDQKTTERFKYGSL